MLISPASLLLQLGTSTAAPSFSGSVGVPGVGLQDPKVIAPSSNMTLLDENTPLNVLCVCLLFFLSTYDSCIQIIIFFFGLINVILNLTSRVLVSWGLTNFFFF